jgi:hypothetical protein
MVTYDLGNSGGVPGDDVRVQGDLREEAAGEFQRWPGHQDQGHRDRGALRGSTPEDQVAKQLINLIMPVGQFYMY